jgi:hypothetical protein
MVHTRSNIIWLLAIRKSNFRTIWFEIGNHRGYWTPSGQTRREETPGFSRSPNLRVFAEDLPSVCVCVYSLSHGYCSTYYPLHACVFITAVPVTKLFAWGEQDSGGHVLWETASRGLTAPLPPLTVCVCVFVCVCARAREREIESERASEREPERARESERGREGARERERERARESERESLCVCVRMYMYVASAIFSRNLPLSIIFSLSWTRHPCHTGDSCATDKQGN